MFQKFLLSIMLFFVLGNVYAQSPFYFLCGPDEDGCPVGDEQYCTCNPVRSDQDQPYCLDLDNSTCNPVASQPDCQKKEIVTKNQGECLAILHQSVETPACKIVPESFCKNHSVPTCDITGNPSSCM